MPGIIKDAHNGKGLGLRFLKHIMRTSILCILIDISDPDYKDKLNILRNELEIFKPELMRKKIILVGNKIDLITDKIKSNKVLKEFILISALKKINLEKLKEVFFEEINRII